MQDLGILFSEEEPRQPMIEGFGTGKESERRRDGVRGADESALEPTGEEVGSLWSRLCPPIRKSPNHPRPTCLPESAGRGSCPLSAVPEAGRNDVIAAGAEGMEGGGRCRCTQAWPKGSPYLQAPLPGTT